MIELKVKDRRTQPRKVKAETGGTLEVSHINFTENEIRHFEESLVYTGLQTHSNFAAVTSTGQPDKKFLTEMRIGTMKFNPTKKIGTR
jgi:hypothetical protein